MYRVVLYNEREKKEIIDVVVNFGDEWFKN